MEPITFWRVVEDRIVSPKMGAHGMTGFRLADRLRPLALHWGAKGAQNASPRPTLRRRAARASDRLSHALCLALAMTAAHTALDRDRRQLPAASTTQATTNTVTLAQPLPLPPLASARSQPAMVIAGRANAAPAALERPEAPIASIRTIEVHTERITPRELPPRGKRVVMAIDLSSPKARTRLRTLKVRAVSIQQSPALRSAAPALIVVATSAVELQTAMSTAALPVVKTRNRGKARRATQLVALSVDRDATMPTQSPAEQPTVAWSAAEIAAAKEKCAHLLQPLDLEATEEPAFKHGACGAPASVRVTSLGKPKIRIEPGLVLSCPMAAALDTWMRDKVQPAATEAFGSPVVRLLSVSSYVCRNRYGRTDGPLSEHALANAIDISGFALANGRTVYVSNGWGPLARATEPRQTAALQTPKPPPAGMSMLGVGSQHAPRFQQSSKPDNAAKTEAAPVASDAAIAQAPESAFLHNIHRSACGLFGTVLGPEANEAHRDHLHLDMKARDRSAYCQ